MAVKAQDFDRNGKNLHEEELERYVDENGQFAWRDRAKVAGKKAAPAAEHHEDKEAEAPKSKGKK